MILIDDSSIVYGNLLAEKDETDKKQPKKQSKPAKKAAKRTKIK